MNRSIAKGKSACQYFAACHVMEQLGPDYPEMFP